VQGCGRFAYSRPSGATRSDEGWTVSPGRGSPPLTRAAACRAIHVDELGGGQVADHAHLADDAAKAVVHIPVRVSLRGGLPVQRPARSLEVGDRYRVVERRAGRAEVLDDLLDLHAAVIDIVGLGLAAVCRSYDTSFAQAVAAVGEGGGRAVRGADAQPVLAIPGVRAAGGVGEGVAVRVGGDVCGGAVHRAGEQAVGGVEAVAFVDGPG
jgi:hypothetical protein